MTDFIIVGRGLAATCLMHGFHRSGITFKVIGDPELSRSSRVAAGIWNPVVFKRLTKSWKAEVLIPSLLKFYREGERVLNSALITPRQIVKPFTEEQEKKLWKKKAEMELEGFLDSEIYNAGKELSAFHIANGYGQVLNAGNLDMQRFLESSADLFAENTFTERFDYSLLKVNGSFWEYKEHTARHVIFCEGHLVKANPYFNWLPLKPAKGEVLTIEGPFENLGDRILNKNGFLMRSGPNRYRVGATYEWNLLSDRPTPEGLAELKTKLKAMTDQPYSLIKHEAGIRPSSIDRRPLVGAHPHYRNLFIFNGLGTKGVMLAPYLTENFVNFFLKGQELLPEANVKRFYHLYEQAS